MNLVIPSEVKGERLDKFLAGYLSQYSRNRIQLALEQAEILVDGHKVLPKLMLKGGELLTIDMVEEPVLLDQPEAIPLRIVYEDESIIVLDKQPGLTVHPGAGQQSGTLLNALLHHEPKLQNLPRAGIVHRLDKDTSGLMVIAKTEIARLKLIAALKQHDVKRTYIALVQGELLSGCTIDVPIGRHPVDRKKMAALPHSYTAKEAMTYVRVLERFKGFTLIEAKLETGRTHQIRVHMAHLGYPLVGDKTYGKKNIALLFNRQALQAIALEFIHPEQGQVMRFEIKPESDLAELLQFLYNECLKNL